MAVDARDVGPLTRLFKEPAIELPNTEDHVVLSHSPSDVEV